MANKNKNVMLPLIQRVFFFHKIKPDLRLSTHKNLEHFSVGGIEKDNGVAFTFLGSDFFV